MTFESSGGTGEGLGATPSSVAEHPPGTANRVPAGRRFRRSIRLLTALAVVLTGVAVAIPLVGGGPPSASAAVLAAVDSTVGQGTSDVTMHVAMSAGSRSVTLNGTGQVDYATHAMSLDIAMPGSVGSLRELVVGGTMYVQTPDLSSVVPGKTWVSLDLSSLGAGGAGASPTAAWGAAADPLAMLPLLEKAGGTVEALGSSTEGGRSVRGYRVTFDRTAIAAQLGNLPSYLRNAESTLDLGGLTLQLEVAGTGLLTSMAMNLHGSALGAAFSGTATMEFSTFGTAVTLSAPPVTQVVTLQRFLGDAAGSAGSAGSARPLTVN